jgi:F-type H+-transporting ATPase subunit b
VNANALLTQVAAAGVAPQAAEKQLLDVDGTLFVMLGIFLVLLLVLWQLLWKPYLRTRDERVARTEGARERASQLDAQTASRLQRIEDGLAEARRAGEAESAKLRQDAQVKEQQITTEAHEAARKLMADARVALDATVATEKVALQEQASQLARDIAEKALGRSLAS